MKKILIALVLSSIFLVSLNTSAEEITEYKTNEIKNETQDYSELIKESYNKYILINTSDGLKCIRNGEYLKNKFINISEEDYYFNDNGISQDGLIFFNGDIYFLKNKKLISDGLYKINSSNYFFRNKKAVKNKFIKIEDTKYYFDKDGKMALSKWINLENKWTYLNKNGVIVENGWNKINEKWFYFKDGFAISDEYIQEFGKTYYLDNNCYMVSDKWIQDNNSNWLYFKNNGEKVEIGWNFDGKYWSYFEDGKAVSNKLIENFENKYYINDFCYMVSKQWIKMDDGNWMYFGENGKLVKDSFIGYNYVGFDGVWFDTNEKNILDVPNLSQLKPYYLPMGCEGTSFTMAIKYKGVNEYTQKYINLRFPITSDPRTGFIGTPFSGALVQGTTPTIWPEALIKFTKDIYGNVENLTGCDLTTMLKEIDKGNPVVYWYSYTKGKMVNVSTPNGNILNSTSMHCVTLVGYDSSSLYYNDPITNKTEKIGMRDFYGRFVKYGRMAVVVR